MCECVCLIAPSLSIREIEGFDSKRARLVVSVVSGGDVIGATGDDDLRLGDILNDIDKYNEKM